MLQDVRYALRTLRANPAFALSATLALALGIGANTAIFSVVDGVLLRPLPFPDSTRLMNAWETNDKRDLPKLVAAPGNYYDWAAQNRDFVSIGAFQQAAFNLAAAGGGEPEQFLGAICDPGFFATLGISPLLGRTFTEAENQPGADGVVVIGYGVWKTRFGGDRSILGRALEFNGRMRAVIGVMPPEFSFPSASVMWGPLALDGPTKARRDFHRLRVIGRLKSDVPVERARADFMAIHARLAQQYPDFDQDESVALIPLLQDTVGSVRPALIVLAGAVVFVLLIACANVANLMLAKAAGRQREIAIRASLGASRGRVLSQMVVESLTIACIGGVLGLGVAYLGFHALLALAPDTLPRLHDVTLDSRALAFTAAASLLTGLIFGLAPAWHAMRVDVQSMLKEGSRGTGARGWFRGALVVAQVASALVLLTGAGLLMRSFYELEHVDPGFQPDHLMTMRLMPAPFKYRGHNDLQIQLARGILAKTGALPGVRSVGISTDIPLLGNPSYIARFEGRPPVAPSQAPVLNYFAVTPGFFSTMGMRIVRGRDFNQGDSPNSPMVAIVNQALVDQYFPNQEPIGKRLEIAFSTPPRWREIVGVVANVKTTGLDQTTPTQVYAAYLQAPSFLTGLTSSITVVARTAQDPAALGSAMKEAILSVDRAQPVFATQPMTDIVAQSIAQRRLALALLAFFAASAMLLAALGLYGVMAYNVTLRTNEIGIRMALGAQQSEVLLYVERQGLVLTLGGVALGLIGAFALTRLMGDLLFHVESRDPLTFAMVAGMLIVVSLAACYLPARRASRVDPIVALRYQ
jgi:putative ABC transport system permease protein